MKRMNHYTVGKGDVLTIKIGEMTAKFKAKENIAIYDWHSVPPCKQIIVKGLYFVNEQPILFTLTLRQMENKNLIEEVS